MAYTDHFLLADEYINHLDDVIDTISDFFIKSRNTGFLAVSAVTVFELAIKTIFIEFAEKKHKVLKNFTTAYFERINGRIKTKVIKEEYVAKYGNKYVKQFEKYLKIKETEILRAEGASISAAYANIVTWRNQFAHEGTIPTTATYEEVKKAYYLGKHIIECLAVAMRR